MNTFKQHIGLICLVLPLLNACSTATLISKDKGATLTADTLHSSDLSALPEPSGRIRASVYAFKDQTGQYRPAPSSSFSTAVTQGAGAILIEALNESGWFVTLEREGLNNLLTERKIARAVLEKAGKKDQIANLLAADILFEGGIVGYDSNIRTGGDGAKYLGIGLTDRYRVDQVTVNLRAVDVRTGRIISNVSTSKKVYSKELRLGVFKFIQFKELLELESGVTSNEPIYICIKSALEAAVTRLIVKGIFDGNWTVKDPSRLKDPVIQKYRGDVIGLQ